MGYRNRFVLAKLSSGGFDVVTGGAMGQNWPDSPVWGRCSAAEFDGMFFNRVSWVLDYSDLYGNPVDYDSKAKGHSGCSRSRLMEYLRIVAGLCHCGISAPGDGVGLEAGDMINIRQKLFPPRSPFCCQFFQSLWENREKHGLSIVVDQNDHQSLFWLQMRGLDSDKEEQYARIGKATAVDKSKLSVSDLATSCALTLWTRTPIRYCPHCGKNLHRFYGRNWRTLFAPVLEHHMLGITKGE